MFEFFEGRTWADHGGEPRGTARAWLSYNFSAEQAEAWLNAGTFEPSMARDLQGVGLTPQEAGREVAWRGSSATIGYWVSNSDMTTAEAMQIARAKTVCGGAS